jgi:hypothetical protein
MNLLPAKTTSIFWVQMTAVGKSPLGLLLEANANISLALAFLVTAVLRDERMRRCVTWLKSV